MRRLTNKHCVLPLLLLLGVVLVVGALSVPLLLLLLMVVVVVGFGCRCGKQEGGICDHLEIRSCRRISPETAGVAAAAGDDDASSCAEG